MTKTNDLIIQDVANMVIRDKASGKVMANTKLQMSSLEGTVNTEDLRAGIGNKKIYKMKSEKDLTVTTRSAIFDPEMLSLTQGVDIVSNKEVVVTRIETICKAKGITEVTLKNTPDGDVTINGETFTVALQVVSLVGKQDLIDAEEVTVIYEETVTGDSIEFNAEKFSKNVSLELHTIAYDLKTNEVDSDLYFIFPKASISDEFSLSFEAGSVITPELTFDILQPDCGSAMGEMVRVYRKP